MATSQAKEQVNQVKDDKPTKAAPKVKRAIPKYTNMSSSEQRWAQIRFDRAIQREKDY